MIKFSNKNYELQIKLENEVPWGRWNLKWHILLILQ